MIKMLVLVYILVASYGVGCYFLGLYMGRRNPKPSK